MLQLESHVKEVNSNSYQPFPYSTLSLSEVCSEGLGNLVAGLRELLSYLLNINSRY